MKNRAMRVIVTVMFFILGSGVTSDIVQAREKKPQTMNPSKVRPFDRDLKSLGQKGGGETPDPPADPSCAHGSVGPITHETVKKSCKVDGKDGQKTCYIKSVKCLSGPGESEYAQTENCGKCFVLPNHNPGQTQTHTGQ